MRLQPRLPRERLLELAFVVPVSVGYLVLRGLGLVSAVTPAAMLVTLWATYLGSLLVSRSPGGDRRGSLLWVRTGVPMLGTAVMMYITGWGPMLAIGYVTVLAVCLRSIGSRAVRPLLTWALLGLAGGQLAIAVGLAPSRLDQPFVHALAAVVAFSLTPAFVLFGRTTAQHEESEDRAVRLLDLARRLAEPGTQADVCQRVAEAVPRLTGLSRATVALWDADARVLSPVGVAGSDADDGLLAGDEPPASTPIVSRGRLIGAVTADFASGTPSGQPEALRARLAGIADQAAVALESSRLLEQERAIVDHLTEANRLKSEFLAVVSHELRTPLSVMVGAARTLQWRRDQLDDDMRDELVDAMVRRGDQLALLVEDLLEASADLRLDCDAVDLGALARSAVGDAVVVDPGCRVQFTQDGPDVVVAADASRVRQVLDNLVGNALKYAPGSTVTVEVGWAGDSAWLCVGDTGAGMTDAQAARAFDPFYQAETSAVRAIGGLGLGLHICRRIVEAHGGRIWIESQPGMGTRVKITIPAERPAVVAATGRGLALATRPGS